MVMVLKGCGTERLRDGLKTDDYHTSPFHSLLPKEYLGYLPITLC